MPCSRSTIWPRSWRGGACCGTRTPEPRSIGCGPSRSPTARSPTWARRSRSWSRTTAIWPRTRPPWSRSITRRCRRPPTAARPRSPMRLPCAASSNPMSSRPTGSPMGTPRRPSARPPMCCTRISGSIAAPRIRSRAAASWSSSAAPTNRSPSGPRPRRPMTCANPSRSCSISRSALCGWRRPISAAALVPSSASIRKTSPWWRRRNCSSARSNGSRTGASISPMRCRSATNTGRSISRPMRRARCSAFAAACCTISAPMRCRTSTCPTTPPPR